MVKGDLLMNIEKINIKAIASTIGLEHPEVLTFRPYGKKAKGILLEEINKLLPGDSLEFDFSEIEICDVSFVDEIIIEIQLYLRKYKDNLFFVSHINEPTLENLEASLAFRETKEGIRVPILINLNGVFKHIGTLEPNLKETFDQLSSKREITARDVAELNDIAINSASNRLKKLYDLRLVLRYERIDENGRQHIYSIPS